MSLNWENYGDVADALYAKHKNVDLVNIKDEDVIKLVNELDDFDDERVPEDKELIDAVVYAWIGIEMPPGEDITHSYD